MTLRGDKKLGRNPVGVMPRFLWDLKRCEYPPPVRDEIRAQDLLDAVFRYRADDFEPKPEWSDEFAEILARCVREGP